MVEDIVARLRKMSALASRGVGGEADNARALLARIAAKHGIDLAAIEEGEESVSRHVLRTGSEQWRRNLFAQIVWVRKRDARIFYTFDPPGYWRRRRHNAMWLDCTNAFFVEVVAAWEVLCRAYERQRKMFFRAFCEANDLLLSPSNDDDCRPTEEEIADAMIASRMAVGIERTVIHKQLQG